MKHMILSLKMKGDVISDHFLILWFQKILWIQSVLGLRRGVQSPKVTFGVLNVPTGG